MSPLLRRTLPLTLLAASLFGLGGAGAAAAAPSDTVWGCYPGATPNPCEGSLKRTVLSSTVIQPRKVARVEEPVRDPNPPVDCFYVYPTVSSVLKANAPKYVTHEIQAILQFQASHFSQHCRMFAPVYRQATTIGILPSALGGKTTATGAFELGYSDVLGAWKDYLANENKGRGVVLIGHSQGSGMLIRLMREQIDPDPAVRSRLVSAIVPGGNLTVKTGQRTGGDLQNIPTCASGTETGCVMAWSLFSKQPPRDSTFGRPNSTLRDSTGLPTAEGVEVVCTSPSELSGDGPRQLTLTRSGRFPGVTGAFLNLMYLGLAPKADTPWIQPGERYTARCKHSNGAHVLMVGRGNWQTVLPLATPLPGWGLHLADINLPLGNLLEIVDAQGKAYAAAHPVPAAG